MEAFRTIAECSDGLVVCSGDFVLFGGRGVDVIGEHIGDNALYGEAPNEAGLGIWVGRD